MATKSVWDEKVRNQAAIARELLEIYGDNFINDQDDLGGTQRVLRTLKPRFSIYLIYQSDTGFGTLLTTIYQLDTSFETLRFLTPKWPL